MCLVYLFAPSPSLLSLPLPSPTAPPLFRHRLALLELHPVARTTKLTAEVEDAAQPPPPAQQRAEGAAAARLGSSASPAGSSSPAAVQPGGEAAAASGPRQGGAAAVVCACSSRVHGRGGRRRRAACRGWLGLLLLRLCVHGWQRCGRISIQIGRNYSYGASRQQLDLFGRTGAEKREVGRAKGGAPRRSCRRLGAAVLLPLPPQQAAAAAALYMLCTVAGPSPANESSAAIPSLRIPVAAPLLARLLEAGPSREQPLATATRLRLRS